MNPYAKYSFIKQEKFTHYFSEYILGVHTGIDIPNFPTEWISLHRTHLYNGALHSAFKKMQEAYLFTHAISLEGITFIGLRRIPELQGFNLGYFGEDGVLLRFETHESFNKKVTLYFFENMKKKLSILHYLCISGRLEIDMECETIIPKIERPSW
jgi:hypothetical protein